MSGVKCLRLQKLLAVSWTYLRPACLQGSRSHLGFKRGRLPLAVLKPLLNLRSWVLHWQESSLPQALWRSAGGRVWPCTACCAAWAVSNGCCVYVGGLLAHAGIQAAARMSGGAAPRASKLLPPSIDMFGWCTWDAFYSTVSARGIQVGGLRSCLARCTGVLPCRLLSSSSPHLKPRWSWLLTEVALAKDRMAQSDIL